MSWLRSSVMPVSVFGLLIGGAIPASAQQSGLVDDEPDAITGDLGLSNGTVQFCVDEGMSLEEIEADSGECLTRFWTAERVAEAAENAEHQDEVLSEADLSGGSAQHRDGLFSEDDDRPEVPQEVIDRICSPRDQVADPLPGWAEEILEFDGTWVPGISEEYESLATGRLVATRPTVDQICGRNSDDPGERVTYSCSASLVETDVGDHLIITAAHCLHEGSEQGAFYQDVMFFPGWNGIDYFHGSVGGSYRGEVAGILPGHIEDRDYLATPDESASASDLGFLVVGEDEFSGDTASDQIEAHSIEFSDDSGFTHTTLGYPSYLECAADESPLTHICADMDVSERESLDPDFPDFAIDYRPGHLLLGCESSASLWMENPSANDMLIMNNCFFDAGASGGPWLVDFDSNLGTGVVRSVTATLIGESLVGGPFLSDDAEDLYECMSEVVDNTMAECREDWVAQ